MSNPNSQFSFNVVIFIIEIADDYYKSSKCINHLQICEQK